MKDQRVDDVKSMLQALKSTADEETAKKLQWEKCDRIIEKLSSFSSDCEACNEHLTDLEKHIIHLNSKSVSLAEDDIIQLNQKSENISSHLQKEHKMVTSGYYLSIYMTTGMSFGVVLGLILFDNIALWLPIGFGIGIAMGAAMDADAQKKGMVL
jgi:tetrahydromethanopterin S-methyltransferase subunit B